MGSFMLYSMRSSEVVMTEKLPAWNICMTRFINFGGVFAVFGFSLVFAVHPYDNMKVHSFPFVGMIFAQPLMYANVTYQSWLLNPDIRHLLVKYLSYAWVVLSIVYSLFIFQSLFNGPNAYPPTFLFQPLDYIWVAMAFSSAWLLDIEPIELDPTAQEVLGSIAEA